MKHTPKPWAVIKDGCPTSHGLPIIVKANGHVLAMLADRNLANARLIAMSPELLDFAISIAGLARPGRDAERDADTVRSLIYRARKLRRQSRRIP